MWPLVSKDMIPLLRNHADKIVIGGLVAGHKPWRHDEVSPADYVISGEGELGLAGLIGALTGSVAMEDVPGLWRPREPGEPRNPVAIPDFAWHPTPSYAGLDLNDYDPLVSGLEAPFLPYQFLRGCPYTCAYCADESSRK